MPAAVGRREFRSHATLTFVLFQNGNRLEHRDLTQETIHSRASMASIVYTDLKFVPIKVQYEK